MKELDSYQSNNSPKKQRERSKKQKSTYKLFTKDCWPKVMISRDNIVYKKIKDSSRSSSLSFIEESSSDSRGKEEKNSCEHLYCENGTNFEEEQDVCLISSSSEIQKSFELRDILRKIRKNSKPDGLIESEFGCLPRDKYDQQRPIFVDLTTDEKNTWKQTILKQFCDVKTSTFNEMENGNEKCSTGVVLEPRIIIADSSSKLNYNGNGSLATALRDRGPCMIPVQPNRSLPIRPAPSVPTRFFRKDYSSSFVLPKSSSADIEEIESVKPIGTLLNEELHKEGNINCEERIASKDYVSSMNYVVPQISSVGSLSMITRRNNNDMEHEKDNVKENRKKKRSQGGNSSQGGEDNVESSIKEFLTNFCGSNAAEGIQNLCTDKCVKATSTTKENSGNKVPPLRLKKVVHTEMEGYDNSRIIPGSERESNYRIITDTTSESPTSPNPNWNDMLYEKDTNLASLSSDSYKLKYRRNRLKQKLRELRGKASELAKEMANDSNNQQSTRLRQVMNRYEKQIENLSKLHGKLSAALSVSREVIDVNEDSINTSDNKYPCMNLNERSSDMDISVNNISPTSSPEPPKLSPRSSLDCILPEEIRNSPPILPRVCLTVPSNQDSVEEELQVAEKKVWPIDEELMKPTFSMDPLQADSVDKDPSDLEKHARTTPMGNNINVDENSDRDVDKKTLNNCKNIAQFPKNNRATQEKKDERSKPMEGFSQCRLVTQESEKIKCLEFSDTGPIISSITSCVDVPTSVQENETFEIMPDKQPSPSRKHILQSNFYESNQEEVLFSKIRQGPLNAQKVSSSSVQQTQFDIPRTVLNQKYSTRLRQNYKGEEIPIDSVQRNGGNHSITEQFPTLGNWLARISKKQASISKSKLQTSGNASFTTAENTTRQVSGTEIPKMIGPNINNNIMNVASQRNAEKLQCHHQPQQLHIGTSVTLSQPIAAVPPLRPGICPPISMTQFYPNNYTIDPYNSATLSYQPTICPYGTYPYHPRLHSSSLPGYHFPIQENLRSMQHMDKRFPLIQDPIVRYSSSSTNTLQHSNNLEFDRLRGNSTTNNIATSTCLPSLFLSSPSLSSSHQTLARNPLIGYSTNNQFSRNRMIPDVVAAAAAAAVAAAASFDRQRDTLTYNRTDTDTLSTAGITNIIDTESPHVSNGAKSINRDVTNQTQDNNFNEENHENTKYQQMQNFLFDRLGLVKNTDNFAQTNSAIDSQTMTSIIPPASYRMPLISSHAQLSKNVSTNEPRDCETPHLGKMNRSPNSLHNFTCSNCGIIGPKFKCLGCEMAFYCDERCQEKHWYIHVQRCPKKMPKLKKLT